MNYELIKDYELNKKASEAIDASEAEFVCATMSGYKLMFIRKRQSR